MLHTELPVYINYIDNQLQELIKFMYLAVCNKSIFCFNRQFIDKL
jgi:hypothetical protein